MILRVACFALTVLSGGGEENIPVVVALTSVVIGESFFSSVDWTCVAALD